MDKVCSGAYGFTVFTEQSDLIANAGSAEIPDPEPRIHGLRKGQGFVVVAMALDGDADDLPEMRDLEDNERKGLRWALLAMLAGLVILLVASRPIQLWKIGLAGLMGLGYALTMLIPSALFFFSHSLISGSVSRQCGQSTDQNIKTVIFSASRISDQRRTSVAPSTGAWKSGLG